MVRAGKKRKSIDPQVVELLGRNKLISDLLRAGLEVALPMRNRGNDAHHVLNQEVAQRVSRGPEWPFCGCPLT